MPIAGFDLDNEYRLNFKISTVVDDSKYGGGSHRLVSVSMWKSNGRLNVELAKVKNHSWFPIQMITMHSLKFVVVSRS